MGVIAPVTLALVCFRACPRVEAASDAARNARLDVFNEAPSRTLWNSTGRALLSHTKLHDKITLRLSIRQHSHDRETRAAGLGIVE